MTRNTITVRTLLVEDDPAIARLHRSYLESLNGFELVAVVHDLAGAIAALRSTEPDLVLLDLRLPDGTGIDLLRTIRRARPESFDVIMTTAVADHVHVESAVRLGVVDYLVKPFTRPEFDRRLTAYREGFLRRSVVDRRATLTQAEVDALRGAGPGPSLPKGLSSATLALVVGALDRTRARTATEIAAEVGVSRVSARRYLEHLVAQGRAGARPRYGGAGRPSTEYLAL